MLGLIFDRTRDTCTIQDIWDENSKQFIDCDLLYSQLIDRKNCISEYSKIKKCIPKDYLKFLKNVTDVQSFKIIPNFWPVKFYIINIIPFILTFWY
jgi:hypothetical protein